jgi:hypothetical protein
MVHTDLLADPEGLRSPSGLPSRTKLQHYATLEAPTP